MSNDLTSTNPFFPPGATDDDDLRQRARTATHNGGDNLGFAPRAFEAQFDEPSGGPSVLSAVSGNRLLVCAAVILVAGMGVAYALHKPKVYVATATIAMIQPQENQALGEVATATPPQYLDSQVVLLKSEQVAQKAAAIGNSTLHRSAFNVGDFSGPTDTVTITTQTVADPNSTVVDVAFSSGDAATAQAGANALLFAYDAVLDQQIETTVSHAIAALNASLNSINAQIASLGAHSSPLNTQLVTSLVSQRSNLMNQESQAQIDERVALSQSPPMTLAFPPKASRISRLAKEGALGAVIGLLIGVCAAYTVELRRTSR